MLAVADHPPGAENMNPIWLETEVEFARKLDFPGVDKLSLLCPLQIGENRDHPGYKRAYGEKVKLIKEVMTRLLV